VIRLQINPVSFRERVVKLVLKVKTVDVENIVVTRDVFVRFLQHSMPRPCCSHAVPR
jgi:hypothetical protein